MRDEDVRTACMARLSLLVAEFGEDIPYVGALKNGFPFRGNRVPFLNYQKGIYRAKVQKGPAALSIQTSSKSPYDDEVIADGFRYAYRAGDIDQADNRALRAAHQLQVPLTISSGRDLVGTSRSPMLRARGRSASGNGSCHTGSDGGSS